MPNRILKESVCTSDSIDGLSWFEEVLFYRLIVNCDDYGRFDGRPAIIKNRLFPLKDNLTAKTVSGAINKLANAGLVTLYVFEGKPYLYLPTWNHHQSVRAKRSKYPAPESGCLQSDESENICKQMISDDCTCSRNPIQSESESESNPIARARVFVPPSLDEVKAYCEERRNGVDAKAFFDYYNTPDEKGRTWVDSRGARVRNWKQKVISWEGRNTTKSASRPPHFMDYKQRRYTEDELKGMGFNLLEEK